jgi:hypothetical protein
MILDRKASRIANDDQAGSTAIFPVASCCWPELQRDWAAFRNP